MKKLTSLLTVIFLFFSISAFAKDVSKGSQNYIMKDSNGNDLIRYTYSIIDETVQITAAHLYEETDNVTFPSIIEGNPVEVSMSRGAFTGNAVENVKRIEFEEGISKIKFILNGRKNLKEVLLPESLKELDASLSGCGLEKITIPSHIETIPGCFVNNCTNLKEVNFPNGLETIKEDAFSSCTSLENITLPNNLKTIEQSAFNGCTALKEIVIPKGIEGIKPYTFANCKNLKTAELPEGIEYIGNYAFDGTGLENIMLPKTLKEIGSNALSHTQLGQITIPSGVKSMGEYALSGCTQLKKLTMSASTQVPVNVFWSSTNLEDVAIEGEMTKQLFNAFCEKTAYGEKIFDEYDEDFIIFDGNYLAKYKGKDRNPVIPENVTELGEYAFRNAEIDTVTFSDKIKEIPYRAFSGSTIKELTVPSTVKTIGKWAFMGCTKLEKIKIQQGVQSIEEGAFMNCILLSEKNINIDKSVHKASDIFKQTPLDKDFHQNIDELSQETVTDAPKETDKPATPTPEVLTVTGGGEPAITVNDKAVYFPDAQPFVDDNGRTQVPIRAVSEMLDCKVDWDGENKTAQITRENGDIIKLTLDSDIMTVNDKSVQMDTQAIIKDDRTYIPVRFVAEAMGLTVEWVE